MSTREKIILTLALALTLGLIGYTLLGPGGGKYAQLQSEWSRLEAENQRLKAENQRLALEVEALKTRPDYQEKVAREELGLIKPDELIVRLPEKPDGGQPDQ